MKKGFLFLIVFLCSLSSVGQKAKQENLDTLFNSIEENNIAMGTISIAKKGKTIYQKSIGFSDLKNKKKANEYTKYRIASVTKTYTATIILQLINEGKLNLETTLNKYFPRIKNASKITVENLLRHQSGLYNITNEKDFIKWINKPRDRNEILDKIIKNGVVAEPSTQTAYSNTNFILLSYIAEDVDGKSFSKIIAKRIVKPLHLKQTAFGKEINSSKNEAISYYKENNQWNTFKYQTNLKGTMGAGCIVSTAKEVTSFYYNLFAGKLIPKKLLKEMTTSKDGIGMGVSELNYKGLKIFGHNGGMDGFHSISAYIPEKDLAIAFTFNASTISTTESLIKILDAYFKDDPRFKSKSKVNITSSELDKYLGIYSADSFPAKISFTKEGNVLFAKATGQPIFKLIAIKKNTFKYDAMDIVFTFKEKNKVLVTFGGKEHLLSKE